MIEQIIKRNGMTEAFDPSKLIKWMMWADTRFKNLSDWAEASIDVINTLNGRVHSQTLQKRLIRRLLELGGWANNCVAGRLYACLVRKEIFGDKMPTVRRALEIAHYAGLARKFNYTDDEWTQIESFIDHDRDNEMAYFQIRQVVKKYSIQNRHTKKYFETPQITYMRLALALAESEPVEERMIHAKNWYDHFSLNRINSPTPNYQSLGTYNNGLASCCLFGADDTAASIAAGQLIANTMVYMGSGIGGTVNCRSEGEPIRNGAIIHQGKLPYYMAYGKTIKSNKQGTRGGAGTFYYNGFDKDADGLAMAQNPRTPEARQNRDLHFGYQTNAFFAWKAARNEDVFAFNTFTAPDLMEKFYSGDIDGFAALYKKYEADEGFVKHYRSAREFIIKARRQSYEVGTHYPMFVDEVNRHTPFLEPIRSSNLCAEIMQPTKPYMDASYLYRSDDHQQGEVSMCSLAALVVSNLHTDEEYESAAYYAAKMIDKCIDLSDYPFPHVAFTSRMRRNAGIGMTGVATVMARAGVKYSEQAGLEELDRIAERHSWFCIKAALKLGQEKGNAPWIHKTKWPQGWLPRDTYNRGVDELVAPVWRYDWDRMSQDIIDNGGIRFSCVIAHMPTESSSKSSGAPNSFLPIRELWMAKTDGDNLIDWAATDSNILADKYELAWKIPIISQIQCWGVVQKHTDGGGSYDLYADRSKDLTLYTDNMLAEYLEMVKRGLKSHYYQNSLTTDQKGNSVELAIEDACGPNGGCKL
jgi:ribonucleoside-diphosphate reductase alpha chain